MRQLICRFFFLFGILAFLIGAEASGQNPSHEFGDPSDKTPPKNLKKLLDGRRGKSLLDNFDNEMLRNLIKHMPRDIDPKQFDDASIKKLLDQNPDLRDQKNLDRLKDLVREQWGDRPNPIDDKVPWQNVEETLKKVEQFHKDNPNDPNNPMVQPVNPMAIQQPPNERPNSSERPNKQENQTEDFAKFFAKNFGNSPEMREMAQDFAKLMSQSGKGDESTRFLSELGNQWKSFTGSDGSGKDLAGGDKLKEFAAGLKMPSLNMSGSGGGSSKPSTSSGGGWSSSIGTSGPNSESGGGISGGSWVGPMLIALFVLAAFYIWLRRAKNKPEAGVDDTAGTRLWPVNPDAVATREDVIKAFEFLSVSKCGEEAINWHHRQIADRMGANVPDQRLAADELAGLYEKARYTPTNEPFSDTEIAEARARLCQIAGAPTV